MSTIKGIVREMRPYQWYKQVLVFIGVFFSGMLFDLSAVADSILAAISFSFVASAVYIMNDIADREEDRKHPEKKHRPIASGEVPVHLGAITGAILCLLGGIIGLYVNLLVVGILGLYLLQNVIYSLVTREIMFVDLMFVSFGFVLRSLTGVYAIDSTLRIPSEWLLLCTFLAATLLSSGKRIAEMKNREEAERGTVDDSMEKIYYGVTVFTSCSLFISYALYTVLDGVAGFVLTLPFAMYAIFRYFLLVEKQSEEKVGKMLIEDTPFMINGIVWLVAALLVLYREALFNPLLG